MKISLIFIILALIPLIIALPNDANNKIDFTYPQELNTSTYNVSYADTCGIADITYCWSTLDEGVICSMSDILTSSITNNADFISSTQGNDTYLKLDGSNANQHINIGDYFFQANKFLSNGLEIAYPLISDTGLKLENNKISSATDIIIEPGDGDTFIISDTNAETTMTFSSGSITDSSGQISFGNENLFSGGDLEFTTYTKGLYWQETEDNYGKPYIADTGEGSLQIYGGYALLFSANEEIDFNTLVHFNSAAFFQSDVESTAGNIIGQKLIPKTYTDSDFDNNEVINSGIGSTYYGGNGSVMGMLMINVRSIPNHEYITGLFRIDGNQTFIISANALFNLTKDNLGTYNFYWENNQYKFQNKVGNDRFVNFGMVSPY